ncbi:hypothetical protein [Lysobacter sp. MMG2]|uniref:hypothetical protein n=1 Tax=Lysobacter sp. MMG2 TaxID=2801338 RepID=UPI001C23BE40|nr:hypothetical protein [Lysobacter sp. MMG2]
MLLLALAACQREPTPSSPSATAASATPRASQPVQGNAFAVQITLSPAAHDRLASQRESLIVSADYFGYPSAQAQAQRVPGSENPWLTLHRAQMELDGAQLEGTATARFPAVALDTKQLAWTDAPEAPQVNINVYSGRRSSPDNLLDCGMFQDTLAVAARAPIRVSCALIGENSR